MALDRQKEQWRCAHCGRIHFPDPEGAEGVRVLEPGTALPCPVCGSGLALASLGERNLHYCRACRGMLIPMAQFLAMVQELRARREAPPEQPRRFSDEDLKRRIRCPQCRAEMLTHPYAGPGAIVIDNCPACEVNWLDHGELLRVVNAPQQPQLHEDWEMPANSTGSAEPEPVPPGEGWMGLLRWLLRE
jgi:Zn-finger nucleic acid-binding protein